MVGGGKIDDGWYLQLDSAERVIHKAVIRGSNVFFNTLIPNATPCSGGGSGYLMSVSMINGGPAATPAFDVNGDQVINALDRVNSTSGQSSVAVGKLYDHGLPGELSIIGRYRYVGGSNTTSIIQDTIGVQNKKFQTRRVSWMQLMR